MTTQFVFLVGGKGTRLGDRSLTTPKPMLEVAGKPFIVHLMENANRFGITRFLLLAGHLGERVRETLASAAIPQVDVEVVIEPEPLGTAGALRFAANHLEPTFLMANGDSFFDINLLDVALPPRSADWLGKLALRRLPNTERYGVVNVEAGRIVAFEPRGSGGEGVINGGVYLLRRDIVGQIGSGFQSLEQDVFPRTAAEGRLHGSIYDGDFIDIGVPAALDAAQRDIPRMRRRPAAFLDRDGVLNVDHGYIHESSRFEWIPGAKAAVKRLNDAGYYTIIVTNQAGVAHGHYEEPAIHALHAWINSELRSVGAHIDAFYYCPYHPEGQIEAYRRDSEDRKPAPGMLLRAGREWPIDWERSFLIGDRPTDMQVAQAAGVRGYLFERGDLAEFLAACLVRERQAVESALTRPIP